MDLKRLIQTKRETQNRDCDITSVIFGDGSVGPVGKLITHGVPYASATNSCDHFLFYKVYRQKFSVSMGMDNT